MSSHPNAGRSTPHRDRSFVDPQPNRVLGSTADGVPITDGLVVFTNEMQPGLVRLDTYRVTDGDWFDVEYAPDANGHRRRVMQNGERIATRFEGRTAEAAWARSTTPGS